MQKYLHLMVSLMLLIFFSCSNAQKPVFPQEEWEPYSQGDLQDNGWNTDAFNEAREFIIDSTNGTGFVLVIDGKVALRYGDIEELSYLASCRKSILAMVYGNYVKSGKIKLKKTLEDIGMDDRQGLLPIEKQATIYDLITARSGIYHPASNAGDNSADAPERGSQKPGEYFLYNNWDFNAAGAAFEKETGINIYDAVMNDIAMPLQMEDYDRSAQRKSGNLNRSMYQAYHMWFSTRDMARIGLCMLNDGKWNDQQVIPKDWAKEIVSVITPSEEMNPNSYRNGEFGYGYMWWVWDGPDVPKELKGAYSARGAWGQYITVIPKLNAVLSFKTNSVYRRRTGWSEYRKLIQMIIEAKE
ncbi:MAG: serine hydrolase [Bacteroidota bacterium]